MSVINKQKFLAELAKLLTFMYEEDRQRALDAYNELFDLAEDEQLLLQSLNSPLRQAVEVARAYNAGRTSFGAQTGPNESDEYMATIHRIAVEAMSKQPAREQAPEEAAAAAAPVSNDQISLFDAAEEARQEEALPAEEPAEEPAPERAFPAPAEEEPEEESGEDEAEEEEPARLPVQKTLRKPRVLLLILYALLAIPLGMVGFVLLLVPALAALALSVACIIVAVSGISTALTAFPAIANLLVALGAALILLAFGLVFLMLFLWLLAGAIGGMINGLISLGGKWCYKEVPAK